MDFYEQDTQLGQYLHFHYAKKRDISQWPGIKSSNYPKKCIQEIINTIKSKKNFKDIKVAVDAGCAVGRSAFELSKHFPAVIAFDFSKKFIDAAKILQTDRTLTYSALKEGYIANVYNAQPPKKSHPENIKFFKRDAHNIDRLCKRVDLIFAGNLICRLHSPELFLNKCCKIISPKGYLALATPCSWLEEFTKKENWLGGYQDETKKFISTFDGLKKILSPNFQLIHKTNIDFLLKEHNRKYQHTVALITIWQKK